MSNKMKKTEVFFHAIFLDFIYFLIKTTLT